MNLSTAIKSISLLAAITLASCSNSKTVTAEKKADDAVKVEVEKSDYREVPQVNTFTGSIEAEVTNKIAPQSSMRIKKIYVEVGHHVAAGQKLADMDPSNLDQVRLVAIS